jgi:2-aminoadipate transaminase
MENKFSKRLGYIEGSAIREIFKYLADPEIISLAGGNPSADSFPKEDLAQISKDVLLKDGETILQYGMTKGTIPLIEEILKLEAKRGVEAGIENILITTGSGQGIDIMTKAFVDDGDTVLVEAPTFLGAIQTFKGFGANLVAVKTDEDGIILSDLEAKVKKHNPKFFYVIPTFQNPTGVTLAENRRQKLVEICANNNCKVLEDDPYAALRFEGTHKSPLKKFDKDGTTVVRLVSFSKLISPGLRVGAVIADPECIGNFTKLKQGMDLHTPILTQVMVSEYLKSGKFEPHLKEVIASYKDKKDFMLSLIKENFPAAAKVLKSEGGLFLWIELPKNVDALKIFKEAIAKKVAFVPGTHFFANGGHNNTLRLNYSMVSKEKIEAGIKILADVIKENI